MHRKRYERESSGAAAGKPWSKLKSRAAVAAIAAGGAALLAIGGLAASAASSGPVAGAFTTAQLSAACTAGSLRVTDGGAGVYNGIVSYELKVSNAGRVPCDMAAEPELTGRDNRGRSFTIPYAPGAASGVITLAPGQYALANLTTPVSCAGITPGPVRRMLVSLDVRFPGGRFTTDTRWLTPMECGVPAATGFALQPKAVTAAPPLAAAQLSAPATAGAGTTVTYTVRIVSLSRGRLALRACPSFQARLFGSDVNVRTSGALICPAKFLSPGSTLIIHGHLVVPSSARGTIKLIWVSPVFGGLTAGELITITG
jgi:Protein of unknown function (DUF4232)